VVVDGHLGILGDAQHGFVFLGRRADVTQGDGLGGAQADHHVHQVVHGVAGHPLVGDGLIGSYVVAPGADGGHVGALDRVDAVVRATGELELELVGQRRSVHVVDVVVDDGTQGARLVIAGHFAARRADAGHGGAQRGPGATQVEADGVEPVEGLLHVLAADALEHDVAGLAVEGDQPGAAGVHPDIGDLAQQVRGVVHAGRGLHAQGVEFGRIGEQGLAVGILEFGEAGNDAGAVADHAHRPPLPVARLVAVRGFQLAEQVGHHGVVVGEALEACHEGRPGAGLELIENGSVGQGFHDASS
jgi:hypothetical protein